MILLETRLDNIVYRLGLARTRRAARQLVNHGHVMVDGKRVDIPSFSVKPGQEISLREKSLNLDVVNEAIEVNNYVPEYRFIQQQTLKLVISSVCLSVANLQQKSTKHLSLSSTLVNNFLKRVLHRALFFRGTMKVNYKNEVPL